MTLDFSSRYCSMRAPSMAPLLLKLTSIYFPNRLELSLRMVLALPKAAGEWKHRLLKNLGRVCWRKLIWRVCFNLPGWGLPRGSAAQSRSADRWLQQGTAASAWCSQFSQLRTLRCANNRDVSAWILPVTTLDFTVICFSKLTPILSLLLGLNKTDGTSFDFQTFQNV